MVITGLFWIQGTAGLLSYAPAQFQNTVQISNTLDVQQLLTAELGAHISGGTLLVDSPATFNSPANFFDDTTIHTAGLFLAAGNSQLGNDSTKTLDVEATSTFNGPASFNGTTDFFAAVTTHAGATTTLFGNVQLGLNATKTLDVEATATFNAPAQFNQQADFYGSDVILHTSTALTVNGYANFNGGMALGDATGDTIDVPGKMNLHNALQYSFNGRVPLRTVLGPDSDHTYAVSDANAVHVTALSAARQYVISDSGAQDGDFFDFSLDGSVANGQTLDIRTPSGFLCTILAPTSNAPAACRVVRIGGVWRLTHGENFIV
jgi:hypothetical protein